jgi:hypothetical protein
VQLADHHNAVRGFRADGSGRSGIAGQLVIRQLVAGFFIGKRLRFIQRSFL